MSPALDLKAQVEAIRYRVALSEPDHVACLRLSGPGAFAALDALCPAQLFVRDCQMLQTLLLRPDGQPLADLYVCRDDEEFFLLAEGPSAPELGAFFREHAPDPSAITLSDLREGHTLLTLSGPYAWELLAAVSTPEVVGLPYNSFCRLAGSVCFRGGKTGEYGYDLLVPAAQAAALRERILDAGRAFDLGTADLEALDLCALENGFFNVRSEGRAGLDPIELQLQWRLSYLKDFVGSAAIQERRRQGVGRRVAWVVAAGPLAVGDPVDYGERRLGALVNAAASPLLGGSVGLAALERAFAHPGIDRFTATNQGTGRAPLRTVSPPLLNNRSLHVSPQRHRYATRHEHPLPPLFDPARGERP